ncbi:MAG: hypothetical protein R3F43_14140 [bacterium]
MKLTVQSAEARLLASARPYDVAPGTGPGLPITADADATNLRSPKASGSPTPRSASTWPTPGAITPAAGAATSPPPPKPRWIWTRRCRPFPPLLLVLDQEGWPTVEWRASPPPATPPASSRGAPGTGR